MTPSNRPALPPRPLRVAAGAGVALAIVLLVGTVLLSILGVSDPVQVAQGEIDIAHLLRMSAIQAGLTTLLSLVVGGALAWALDRLRFPGRGVLIGLFGSAIVTPGIVVAFGLLAVWGRNGWINAVGETLLGVSVNGSIFGLHGILVAHVILDASFAARILLARLETVPVARLKTGQSLGLTAFQRFRLIDWPALLPTLPGLGAIIFLLAFTSFPIVLLLGGGPANQTLEVAIYSAVRLDFDLAGAVRLALAQIGACALVIALSVAIAPVPAGFGGTHRSQWRDGPGARALQVAVLALGAAGFILPLLAVLAGGLSGALPALLARSAFWSALGTSLVIASLSAVLTLALALALAMGRSATGAPLLRNAIVVPAYVYLAVPAVVLSLGFFLLVRGIGLAPESAGFSIVILANALLSLPFALATLGPPLDAVVLKRGRLIRALGLGGWSQWRDVEWPLLGRDMGVVLALAFCFSLGDLGVIALFGSNGFATLPLMMLRALGSYRSADAAGIAAVLLSLTLVAFVGLPALLGKMSHARA